MAQQRNSMDGFMPRRPNSRSVSESLSEAPQTKPVGGLTASSSTNVSRRHDATPTNFSRSDLDASLSSIDDVAPGKGGRRDKAAKKTKLKRVIKWLIILIIIGILAVGGWFAYKALMASGQIFKGSILDIIKNEPLKEDENGRSNILILGTSEDDPGHDASYLTDSIMVLSVDQDNKNAYMFSLPRDLEVQYGRLCPAGSHWKINAYYQCVGGGVGDAEADRAALDEEAKFVGNLVGLDIQYGVNVNYTVMRELVKAVDGITIEIEGSGGEPGVRDSTFDWKCGLGDPKVSRAERQRRCPPDGHYIDYKNGPITLDAEHALYLAQARGDTEPTYGLARSNFDREINQQKIVKAIREKAMSAGVLTDFGKVSGILDALGNNLRTTFEADEIRTLVDLARDIKTEDIQSISLIDEENPILQGDGQPVAGKYQFDELKAYIKKKLTSDPVAREEAKVVVMNASGVAGLAQREADVLEAQGLTISGIDTAPAGTYGDVEIYQIGDGMTATKDKLASLFNVTIKATQPPVTVPPGTNFVVIFGKDRSVKSVQ